MTNKLKLSTVLCVALSVLMSGCGSVKEKTAPCKRPAFTTAFAEDPRTDCGPMHPINGDAAHAIDALLGGPLHE